MSGTEASKKVNPRDVIRAMAFEQARTRGSRCFLCDKGIDGWCEGWTKCFNQLPQGRIPAMRSDAASLLRD